MLLSSSRKYVLLSKDKCDVSCSHNFYQTVKTFIDDVYAGLCSNEFLLDITYDLADVFGMLAEDKPKTASDLQDKGDAKGQESYSISVNQENLGMLIRHVMYFRWIK